MPQVHDRVGLYHRIGLYHGLVRRVGLRARSNSRADGDIGAIDAADTRANVAALALADLRAPGRAEHTRGERELDEL